MESVSKQNPTEEREVVYSGDLPRKCEHFDDLDFIGKYHDTFSEAPAAQCYSMSSPAVVITHALMAEIHEKVFSAPLLYANILKLLGKSDLQGLSLPQCLRLCESGIEFLYYAREFDENNGAPNNLLEIFEKKETACDKELEEQQQSPAPLEISEKKGTGQDKRIAMPDVNAFKVFEDFNILNEELRKQKKSTPTKFEIVKQSLEDGEVLVKISSGESIIIKGCENDELISDENKRFSKQEFNKNAEEACLADDPEIVLFQDFSKNNLSKADLVVGVLKEKKRPVMVGMRFEDLLHCVLIIDYDSQSKRLFAKRWEADKKGCVSITFDDFNKDAIEAYFFDIQSTNRPERSTIKISPIKEYYDSVIFRTRERLGFKLYTGNNHGLPELVLDTQFEISEVELAEKLNYTLGLGAGVTHPEGAHISASLAFSSETARRIVYTRSNNQNLIVSSVQNARETHPSHFPLWGLEITNKTPKTLVIPTLTAISFHALVNGELFRYKFKGSSFLSWRPSKHNDQFRIKTSTFKRSSNFSRLEKVALKSGEDVIKNVYTIKNKEVLSFEEWPNLSDADGLLYVLKFAGTDGRLYCGLIRAKTEAAERLIIEKFDSCI